MRYEAFVGYNTKQLWIIDNEEDVIIDPPAAVLDELSEKYSNWEEQEKALEEMCVSHPSWLDEKDYWYDIETEV